MFNPITPSNMTTIITTASAANIIVANNADMERAAFMVAKTNGNINSLN